MAFENYYAGDCVSCGSYVAKRAGAYSYGQLFCSEPKDIVHPLERIVEELCATAHAKRVEYFASPEFQALIAQRDADRVLEVERYRLGHIEQINERFAELNMRPATLTKIIIKLAGAEIAVAELDFQQAADVNYELQKRLDRKETANRLDYWKANNKCPRCGGAGQADKWIATGKVCFRCNGSGKY
jgi:hypothetical protein